MALLTVCLLSLGCSNTFDFNSKTILGVYEGPIIFQEISTLDTITVFQTEFDFRDTGELIIKKLDNSSDIDTSNWYINESAETIVIETKYFAGTSINDLITWNEDSLIFRGPVWVSLAGNAKTYLRTAKLNPK